MYFPKNKWKKLLKSVKKKLKDEEIEELDKQLYDDFIKICSLSNKIKKKKYINVDDIILSINILYGDNITI